MKNDEPKTPEFLYVPYTWSIEQIVNILLTNSGDPFILNAKRAYATVNEICPLKGLKPIDKFSYGDKLFVACGKTTENPVEKVSFVDNQQSSEFGPSKSIEGYKLTKGEFHVEKFHLYTQDKIFVFKQNEAEKAVEVMMQKKAAEEALYLHLDNKIKNLKSGFSFFNKPTDFINSLDQIQNKLPNPGSHVTNKYNFDSLENIISEVMKTNPKFQQQAVKYPEIKKILDDAVETDKKFMEVVDLNTYDIDNYKSEIPKCD